MNYANEIKSAITMRQVCELYGLDVNRQGFARCPFHNEKTPSMKVYDGDRGFNCFGCNTHGSVIDFVMKYFNLNFAEAQKKLNDDFFLRLPIGEKQDKRQATKAGKAAYERRKEQERRQQERDKLYKEYDDALTEWVRLDKDIREKAPKSQTEQPGKDFIYACQNIEYAAYRLDCALIAVNDYEMRHGG